MGECNIGYCNYFLVISFYLMYLYIENDDFNAYMLTLITDINAY